MLVFILMQQEMESTGVMLQAHQFIVAESAVQRARN